MKPGWGLVVSGSSSTLSRFYCPPAEINSRRWTISISHTKQKVFLNENSCTKSKVFLAQSKKHFSPTKAKNISQYEHSCTKLKVFLTQSSKIQIIVQKVCVIYLSCFCFVWEILFSFCFAWEILFALWEKYCLLGFAAQSFHQHVFLKAFNYIFLCLFILIWKMIVARIPAPEFPF